MLDFDVCNYITSKLNVTSGLPGIYFIYVIILRTIELIDELVLQLVE